MEASNAAAAAAAGEMKQKRRRKRGAKSGPQIFPSLDSFQDASPVNQSGDSSSGGGTRAKNDGQSLQSTRKL